MKLRVSPNLLACATKSPSAAGQTKNPLKKKVTAYFEDKGFKASDITKAIFFHECLGLILLSITWSTCYFFPPSQTQWLQKPIAKVITLMPASISGSFKTNKVLSSKLGSSYFESSCMRKVIRPLSIPGKLYFTFRAVQKLSEWETANAQGHSF